MQANWKPLSDWKDLPVGTWLVKVKNAHQPYNVAEVRPEASGRNIVVVGNYFCWVMDDPVAYTSFEPYEEN